MHLAKADVVPTQANDYASFAELQAACEEHAETVNHGVDRETGVPAQRLEHGRRRVVSAPHRAVCGPVDSTSSSLASARSCARDGISSVCDGARFRLKLGPHVWPQTTGPSE